MEKNQVLVDLLKRVAEEKHAAPAQIALAWVLARRPYIVPIPARPSSTPRREYRYSGRQAYQGGPLEIDQTAAHIEMKRTHLAAVGGADCTALKLEAPNQQRGRCCATLVCLLRTELSSV